MHSIWPCLKFCRMVKGQVIGHRKVPEIISQVFQFKREIERKWTLSNHIKLQQIQPFQIQDIDLSVAIDFVRFEKITSIDRRAGPYFSMVSDCLPPLNQQVSIIKKTCPVLQLSLT